MSEVGLQHLKPLLYRRDQMTELLLRVATCFASSKEEQSAPSQLHGLWPRDSLSNI